MQSRKIKASRELCFEQVEVAPETDLRQSVLNIWKGKGHGWLLGHDLDGLIWGRITAEKMIISYDAKVAKPPFVYATDRYQAWGAPLRLETLQNLRVFNTGYELRLWHTGKDMRGCLVSECDSEEDTFSYDECQILIAGQRIGKIKVEDTTFSLIQGPAGQKQALPVDWDGKMQQCRLAVRHYLKADKESGMLQVFESRLLDLLENYSMGTKEVRQ